MPTEQAYAVASFGRKQLCCGNAPRSLRCEIHWERDVRSIPIPRLNGAFWTIVLQLMACLLPGLTWADAPSKPALTVILARNEILAGQTMGFSIWIENATEARIMDAGLSLFGPPSLKIGSLGPDGTCDVKDTIGLGTVEPGSTLVRSRMCLKADSSIAERDENLAFSVSYSLQNVKDNKTIAGASVAEKKMSIGLFGTESVGGVSLRLASYVIPGTFFLMILRLFAPKESRVELGATESVTLSIFISTLLFLGTAYLIPSLQLHFAGIGSTVSAIAFLALCGAAIVLGGILAAVLQGISMIGAWERNARIVQETDRVGPIIQKAVRAAGGKLDPVMMIADGKQYFGSLVVPASNGGRILLGWFQLKAPDAKCRSEMKEWFDKDEFIKPIDAAARWGVEPTMFDPIKESRAGNLEPTEFLWMYFDEKAARLPAGREDLAQMKPLTLT
ncbi:MULTISPECIES: hypothetical protein [unclassified Bradyrhizobium]|uniref:hypothetical protein n=1 Tax=unclassified Bradyrhizobium TaxID=2631580 RepID=UPI002916EE19|nr:MULTISPECIES: hypothetical protein [unclassified Bradyrhizobium]